MAGKACVASQPGHKKLCGSISTCTRETTAGVGAAASQSRKHAWMSVLRGAWTKSRKLWRPRPARPTPPESRGQ